ncbi:restriction endonuclease subunit S [bacterium]|nr:MAG: restriction endonuclease subunit S [bacterium]
MGGEWRERPLAELTDNFDGIRVPVKEADRRPGPFPYYGASGVVDHVDDYLFDGEYLLIAEDGENLRTRKTPVAFLARGKFWVNNHAHIVRGNSEADTRFLMYALSSADISGYLTGSTMPKLTQGNLNRIPLLTPPLPEQRAIAHILGTLDDKIELNRRMSETLEAMARAHFKSWFVDFDPVRAKAEGRDPGLPQAVADLFPDAFEDSELGEVPEGWRVEPLRDCVDVARGLSYKGSGLSDDGMPMHNLNSIYEGGGYKHDGLKRYDGEYRSQHVACAGDLIVANTEQGHHRLLIGYTAIVPSRFGSESLFSHHIYRVRPKGDSKLTTDYLCHMLNTRVMHDIVSGYANGTTVNMLPIDGLQSPSILVPPARAIAAFSSFAAAARMRHEEMIEESRTLAALRDTLLPKLISGELRVKDAERFVADHAP